MGHIYLKRYPIKIESNSQFLIDGVEIPNGTPHFLISVSLNRESSLSYFKLLIYEYYESMQQRIPAKFARSFCSCNFLHLHQPILCSLLYSWLICLFSLCGQKNKDRLHLSNNAMLEPCLVIVWGRLRNIDYTLEVRSVDRDANAYIDMMTLSEGSIMLRFVFNGIDYLLSEYCNLTRNIYC